MANGHCLGKVKAKEHQLEQWDRGTGRCLEKPSSWSPKTVSTHRKMMEKLKDTSYSLGFGHYNRHNTERPNIRRMPLSSRMLPLSQGNGPEWHTQPVTLLPVRLWQLHAFASCWGAEGHNSSPWPDRCTTEAAIALTQHYYTFLLPHTATSTWQFSMAQSLAFMFYLLSWGAALSLDSTSRSLSFHKGAH